MPFCPNCKTEYIAGVKQCADCKIDLVDVLVLPEPEHDQPCPRCSGDVTEDSDFCPHCGILLGTGNFFCGNHGERKAEAVCIICRKLLCQECATGKNRRTFCDEHKEVEVSEDWAVAFKSYDYYEANIVRGKLESSGITVTPRNNAGIGFLADGFIETAIGRTILKYPVKVFVPLDQYLDAISVVNEQSTLE